MPIVFLAIFPTKAEIMQGLLASALGLAGVFAVLIIFYICTKIMLNISIKSNEKKAAKEAAGAGN